MKRILAIAVVLIFGGAVFLLFPNTAPTEKKSVSKRVPETFVFTYKIMRGDSLSLIAQRFGVSLETLERANIVKDGVIYEGDIIGIPLQRSKIASFYTVSEGDTLSSIALSYGTNADSIKKLNRMRDDTVFASRKILVHRSRKNNSRFVVFKVADGDTPGEISRAFGVDLKDIERFNASNPDWRQPGSHVVLDTYLYRYARQTQDSIIETARSYLGSPYKYGGNSTETGIDCSAYVKKVFSFFDVNLPRTVRTIHKYAKGNWIEVNSLEKGDLVFFETDRPFPSHIGIYIDKGNFIHASSARGEVVISNLDEPYYAKTYIGAKRVYMGTAAAVASGDSRGKH